MTLLATRGCVDWGDPAQGGERALRAQSIWVVTGRDQECRSDFWTNTTPGKKRGRTRLYDRFDLGIHGADLCYQEYPPLGQRAQHAVRDAFEFTREAATPL